jgi:uncharacterized Fe-S cluster-containing radical SAM superfamily enzyme
MELINITRESGIPLIGCIAFGIIDRGTDLIQVRPTSLCNLNCVFCSTDMGPFSQCHPVNYNVELDYLLDYIKEVIKFKGVPLEANIDSSGEPLAYPDIIDLVKELKNLKGIRRISMQTNGTLLTKEKIKQLEKAGLTQINLSIQSLDEKKAKLFSGLHSYNLKKVLEAAKIISKSKIQLLFAPVWIPKTNDEDIIEIIKLAKELNAKIGIQKYETYKYSRKVKKVKPITYWKFFKQLEEWEKEFKVKLKLTAKDFNIKKAKRLPNKFDIGEKVQLEVKCKGWLSGQMLGVGKNRTVSINNCKASPGDLVNVKIIENKNNLYLAQLV